jgi:hypothetical protein
MYASKSRLMNRYRQRFLASLQLIICQSNSVGSLGDVSDEIVMSVVVKQLVSHESHAGAHLDLSSLHVHISEGRLCPS